MHEIQFAVIGPNFIKSENILITMKIILVTGIPQVDRGVLIEIVMKRLNMPQKDLVFVDFDDISDIMKSVTKGKDLTIKQISEMIDRMNDEFEKAVIKAMKKCDGVLVINCSLTLNTEVGLFPVLSKEFFESFSPELIILVEGFPPELTNKESEMKALERHQDINRTYAFSYSAFSHSVIDRLRAKKGRADDAARSITVLIRSVVTG